MTTNTNERIPRGDTGDLYRCPECKRLGGAHSSSCDFGRVEARRREEPDVELEEVDDEPQRPGQWPAKPGAAFPTLEHFYAAAPDEVRRRSPEHDFGVWWREGEENWPRYRVSWVERTGELYAVRLTGGSQASDGPVEILFLTLDPEAVLAGWEERCGEPRSLPWVRDRLRSGRLV